MLERLMNEWPFALGESPFRISGLVYQAQKRAYAKRWKGGHQEVLKLIREHGEIYADFFDQTFLSTRKYDVFGIITFSSILSQAVGQTHRDFICESSKRQFEIDMGGFYRIILRMTSPLKIMEKLAESDLYYFDFSPASFLERGSKSAKLVKKEFPMLLRGWYDLVLQSYGQVVMDRCGVKDYELSLYSELTGEKVDTVELCDYFIEVKWK